MRTNTINIKQFLNEPRMFNFLWFANGLFAYESESPDCICIFFKVINKGVIIKPVMKHNDFKIGFNEKFLDIKNITNFSDGTFYGTKL